MERVPQSFLGVPPASAPTNCPAFLFAVVGYNAPMNAMSPDLAHPTPPAGRSLAALAGWLILTYSASATAVIIADNGWYARLAKPTWDPPGWIFGPVWAVLYAMMAVAAWRVWRYGGWAKQKVALSLFVVQWALYALWTPRFFGLHQPGWALAEILVLLAAILATIRAFWRVDRPAGFLLLSYAVWVSFATVLNWTIWRLN